MSNIGVPSPERVLEDIYAVTDEWEWMPMCMPPFDRFEDYHVSTDDIAELLVELQKTYTFQVTSYPECPMDIVDMVLGRPNSREQIRIRSEQYNRTIAAEPPRNYHPPIRPSTVFKPIHKPINYKQILKAMMKKIFMAAICAAALASCEKLDITPSSAETTEQPSVKSRQVQFVIKGITEEYATRATIQSVGMTDLWVFEGTTLLKHQVSTDEDFGLPVISLKYGSHDLTFVASKADGQSFQSVWLCTKVKETFACAMNVTVSSGSSDSRQVELKRRTCQLQFTIQDAIPSDVVTMHIKALNHLSLSSALVGGSDAYYDASLDISSKVGTSGFKPVMNLMTESATDEEDCDVVVEFLNASGVALYHHERTVKLKPNRCTNLTGSYFAGSDVTTLSVDDTWLTQLDVDL